MGEKFDSKSNAIESLANKACHVLMQAGIPARRGDIEGGVKGGPGAEVRVDNPSASGVLVEWNTGEELKVAAVNSLASGVDPLDLPYEIRHFETVHRSMRGAILEILSSAGFDVEEADGHAHGTAVYVKGFLS
ncbi:hypothetical protein ACFQLX_21925 [Streptomyces polyrhachis]|uniref:Uncharacterized protein n=1 Tax=Streptomyces polyrhachis TaxID=1282885 RepID=A0ABW2GJ77_9ACTN